MKCPITIPILGIKLKTMKACVGFVATLVAFGFIGVMIMI